jgi:hypothetical protein
MDISITVTYTPVFSWLTCQPCAQICVLENVMGFLVVAEKVAKFIEANVPGLFGWANRFRFCLFFKKCTTPCP